MGNTRTTLTAGPVQAHCDKYSLLLSRSGRLKQHLTEHRFRNTAGTRAKSALGISDAGLLCMLWRTGAKNRCPISSIIAKRSHARDPGQDLEHRLRQSWLVKRVLMTEGPC